MNEEQRFFATVIGPLPQACPGSPQPEPGLAALHALLDDWFGDLRRMLPAALPQPAGLAGGPDDGSLAGSVLALADTLARCERRWAAQWREWQPARQLADGFDEQAMLLVFGKFNAGKSTLCNFLAERCTALGGQVRGFRWRAGEVQWLDAAGLDAPLRVGATETTAELQGLVLNDRLVLLDTPGLHSVTAAHAELTRRFTDSADGLLWLTSSASPGQVQELDELTRELQRDKPLLPVLTRSDVFAEDEVDGELRRQLGNKGAADRHLQEADVGSRARARLVQLGADPDLLRAPVSISVAVARAQGLTDAAQADAGIDRLYAALRAMIEPALDYKRRKPVAMRLHHLREQVLGGLNAALRPQLAVLETRLRQEAERLPTVADAMAGSAWRQLVPRLPALLDRLAAGMPMAEAGRELAPAIDTALAAAAHEWLHDYRRPASPATRIVFAPMASGCPEVDPGRCYQALEDAVLQALAPCAAEVAAAQASVRRLQADLAALRELLDGFEARLKSLSMPSERMATEEHGS